MEIKNCKNCYYAKSRYGIYYCSKGAWHLKTQKHIPKKQCKYYIDMRDNYGCNIEEFKNKLNE